MLVHDGRLHVYVWTCVCGEDEYDESQGSDTSKVTAATHADAAYRLKWNELFKESQKGEQHLHSRTCTCVCCMWECNMECNVVVWRRGRLDQSHGA